MAGVQRRGDRYRILFRHGGKQHSMNLGRVSEREADAKAQQVDYLLMRLKQGLVSIPDGMDVAAWMMGDGAALPPKPEPAPPPPDVTIGGLRDRYLAAHEGGKLEAETVKGIRRHFGHLAKSLGESRPLASLTRGDLQGYVDARQRAKWRGKPIGPQTAAKEIVTLRAAWNWARREELVDRPCPCDRLRYPKTDEPEPYRTMAEAEKMSAGLAADDAARLRESIYLTAGEVGEFLAHVREHAIHPWIYPLVATAAYAGARRAELLRARLGDVDLEAESITLRERKRSKSRKTTRRVPLSTELRKILAEWMAVHPGGPMLFAAPHVITRSRKRGGGEASPLTIHEVRHHFDRTIAGSRWEAVPGLHTLRHSFISALASRGVDQRLIDEFAGHSTEEQRKRYRHLYPDVQARAIKQVFG